MWTAITFQLQSIDSWKICEKDLCRGGLWKRLILNLKRLGNCAWCQKVEGNGFGMKLLKKSHGFKIFLFFFVAIFLELSSSYGEKRVRFPIFFGKCSRFVMWFVPSVVYSSKGFEIHCKEEFIQDLLCARVIRPRKTYYFCKQSFR